jgi:putative (di)nucleoside polyphosphate hydrolase
VGGVIINKDKKVFVGKRIDNKNDYWQMPQGGIDENENAEVAVYRELFEETGIKSEYLKLISVSKLWFYYDVPDGVIPKLWNGKYRGQKQKWFLFEFTGEDSQIDINNFHPEFEEWKWVKVENLPKLIVPFKERLYREIINEFKPHLEAIGAF